MILSKNEKYCNENTKGYDPVATKTTATKAEVITSATKSIEIIDQNESVLRDTTVLLLNHLALPHHG